MQRVVLGLCLVFLLPALTWAAVGDAASQAELISKHVGFGNPTGGQGGTLCTVNTLADSGGSGDFGSLRYCAQRSGAQWIVFSVSGTITMTSGTIDPGSNKTIDGRGANITLAGNKLWIQNVNNLIIHNISFTGPTENSIWLLGSSSNIWLDHITVGGTNINSEAILLDCFTEPAGVTGVTISWSQFTLNGEGSILIGVNGDVTCNINSQLTLHHNYYNQSSARRPMTRGAKVHSYNNYFKNTSQCFYSGSPSAECFAVEVRTQSQFRSENDIFECSTPTICNQPRVKVITTYFGDTPPDTDTGSAVITGNWSVTGTETYQQRGTVFTPSTFYSYSLSTADATLRDSLTHTTMGAGKVDNPYNYLAVATGATLIAWWEFDETSGATTAADSIGGFTGTLTNMTPSTDWVTGKLGNALNFDGVDGFVATTFTTSLGVDPYSVSIWFKATGTAARTDAIWAKRPSGSNQLTLFICGDDQCNTDGNQLMIFEGTSPTPSRSAISGVSVLDNAWHLATITRDATSLLLYLDGVLVDTATGTIPTITSTTPLVIGNSNNTVAGDEFLGLLDDMRLYTGVLTLADIAAIMAEGFEVIYHLDEVASPANDSGTPGTYDGTWQNTPTPITPGKLNGALSFASASSEYVSVATSPSLSGPATVALWVKVTDLVAATATILSNSDATPSNTQVGLNIDSNGSWNYLYTTAPNTRGFPSAPGAITTGVWIHLAATDDGAGNVLLYQNGTLLTGITPFGTPTAKPSTAPGLLAIGRRGSNSAQYLNGAVDEVHLVSRVMSAGEIAALAAEGSDITAPAAPTNLRVVSP